MNEKNNIRYDVFIKGELVDLVVLTEDFVDKTNWYNWFNDEENTKNMQKHYFPNTKQMQLEYFKNEIENSQTKLQLGIVQKNKNLFCGIISLNDINYINRCCEISAIIGEKSSRTFQYFAEAVKLTCKHAFETLNMNRIYSGTISKEIDELMCRTLGFVHEGISRKAVYKNGEYHDIYHHAMTNQNYGVNDEKV